MCFVRALRATSMTVKFACASAAFCAIVRSNIVIILCISALSHLHAFG